MRQKKELSIQHEAIEMLFSFVYASICFVSIRK